ncbi:TonB-dependent receptor [Hyphomicrobium sp.]|uniref:TonB-dependent receptor n=1 Tax=Hyphomicrobium sp. TaxID=82 RepID=UPI002E365D67|nr:TonB-dependent receptor [Hyphomicrobium sp.]HEX2840539.1 TonB-dependent receptor [Hyphomicrobium sp.]
MSAFCVLAAAPVTAANAQQAAEPADQLPPLVVETTSKKKKSAPVKKAAAPSSPVPQAPSPQPAAQEPTSPPLPGEAGPVAAGEYKADYVTSNKITGPLLDTPQTVTVVPGTVIQERGATNLTQVLRNTPGITFDAGENGFATSINNFKLRGFDTSGSIFTDGVRSSGSFARDMFNVAQVEVVKGAAADNGRGGAAGYVNIVTKTPTTENFVRGESSLAFDDYGTDPLFRSTLDVNQRIGTVAVRMNGMYETGGVMGRDVAEADAYGLAPSIAFGLGTETRAIFSYERLKRDDLPDWGVPGAMVKGTFNYDPAAGRASRDNFYGLRSDYDEVQGDRVLARFEHDLSSNFTLSNQTVWERAERDARYTLPTGYNAGPQTVTGQRQYYDRVNETWSNQTNLAGTFVAGGFKQTISTGVEYTNERSDANQFGTQNPGNTNVFDPDPDRYNAAPLAPNGRNGVEIETVAAYFYDTIQLTRQLDLVGGLRVEHYDYEIASKALPSGVPGTFDGVEGSETTLGGKIGLVYKPVQNGSLYAAYGFSSLPPGSYLSNSDISRAGDDALPGFAPEADPVEMRNYEVGVKWDWLGGKLSTTAALFRTEKHGVPHKVRPNVSTDVFYEEQVVQGLELGIAGNVTERWKVFGGLLLLDSERNNSEAFNRAACQDRPGDYGLPNAAACVDGNNKLVRTTDGDELAFTPNFSATLWMTYDVTDKFTFGGGVQYVGDSWLGRPDDAFRVIKNGTYDKLPSYFLVNLMASYELTDNVDLQLNVDNVFDEDYAVSTNWSGTRATLGAPRTYRIGTTFDF